MPKRNQTAGSVPQELSSSCGAAPLETELLRQALQSLGGAVAAFDEAGDLVFTTLPETEAARSILAYLSERRERASAGGRLLTQRDGVRYTIYPRELDCAGTRFAVFTIRSRRAQARHTGIDWMGEEEVRAEFEQSAPCLSGGIDRVSPSVTQAYQHATPVMIEGEAGAGKEQVAQLIYLSGTAVSEPYVRVSCDLLNDRTWRYLLHSSSSPLFQDNLTLSIRGLHALGAKRARELTAVMRDSAVAERCRVILSGNDVPGGGECDAVALAADELRCAVCIAPPLRERGDIVVLVERYLTYLADVLGGEVPGIEREAARLLAAYSWPRNYLQLREVSERLFIVAAGGSVTEAVAASVLAQENVIRSGSFATPALETDLYILRPLADTERDIARLVVEHLDGNRSRAAEVLGISRTTLWRLLK